MATPALHHALSEAIEKHLAGLRDRLVDEVSSLAAAGVASLHAGALDVLSASGQADILQKLLDATAPFCVRAALLVVKGERLAGWRGRGIATGTLHEAAFTAEGEAGWKQATAAKAQPEAVSGSLEKALAAAFGSSAHAYLLPMNVKERAVAMLYADSGDSNAAPNVLALDLLVRLAGLHLETSIARPRVHAADAAAAAPTASASVGDAHPAAKAVAAAGETLSGEAAASEAAVVEPAPARVPDAYVVVQPAPPGEPEGAAAPEPQPHAAPETLAPPIPAAPAPVAAAAAPVARPLSGPDLTAIPAADHEAHRKAFRMAKVLVDELVLYNRERIEQGRAKRDIYGMIRDEVDKSRAAYEKKWSNTPAGKVDYFHQLFLARVANQDPALLGTEYPGPLV